ncbi:MAG TPA: L-rhamnose/proton symporter RhaT [Planctomycetota bacterium]|nr:L-rhamnose/proton symporter RhaT [Planctomycetota bacterium]
MEIWLGFLFLFLGAACGGSFGLPSKFVRKDTPWEVLWGPFFFFVTILLPVVVGPVLVEDFFGVYASVEPAKLAPILIFGFLWGLGSMTLGLSFAFIGLSLAYALNYGAQIITGSLLPMGIFSPEQILTAHGALVLTGVCVCVVGVVQAGLAATLKEGSLKREDAPLDAAAAKKPRMLMGVLVAIASGILCACWAVASGYAEPVAAAAKAYGNPPVAVAWAVTCLILWGGVLSACGYCAYKLTKNRTWGHLAKPGIGLTLALALAMALLHDAAVFFFALGWVRLGDLGVPVGYPAFMSFAIIVGNFHGFRTGEWKGAGRDSVRWIVSAIVILILGVVVLGQANAMAERAKKNAVAEAAAQPVLKAKEVK